LCNKKRFFFYEKSSLKISRSPITLQKTRFLLVAKARISPVACLFVCLSTTNNIIIINQGRQAGRQAGSREPFVWQRTTDRPFPYLAYSQKEKKRKVKKRKKGGKNSARMWYFFSRFWAWNPKP
jgi:hypothetical protein